MQQTVTLHSPRADGSTLYDHCLAVFESVGTWPQEYEEPEIPEEGRELWDWYWQLRQSSPAGFSGPGPLLYTEILAWKQLAQIDLSATDLHFLMALDRQYLSCWYENQKKLDKSKK